MIAEEIKQSTLQLLSCIENLSEKQAVFKPDAQTWSVLECFEHIFIVDYGIFKIISKETLETTGTGYANELLGNEKLISVMSDRSVKYAAPESVSPKGRFQKLEDVANKFVTLRNNMVESLLSNKIIFDSQTVRHPLLGEMTKKDWLHFLIQHSERHLRQMEMMKAEINFPGY